MQKTAIGAVGALDRWYLRKCVLAAGPDHERRTVRLRGKAYSATCDQIVRAAHLTYCELICQQLRDVGVVALADHRMCNRLIDIFDHDRRQVPVADRADVELHGIDGGLSSREDVIDVVAAIKSAPPHHARALVRHVAGFDHAEIAAIEGISQQNARQRVTRGRAHVRFAAVGSRRRPETRASAPTVVSDRPVAAGIAPGRRPWGRFGQLACHESAERPHKTNRCVVRRHGWPQPR